MLYSLLGICMCFTTGLKVSEAGIGLANYEDGAKLLVSKLAPLSWSRSSVIKRSTECELTLQDNLDPTKEPLILTDRLTVVRPEANKGKGVINVGKNSNLLLACTGKGNSQEVSNQLTASLECKNGQLTVEGKKVADQGDLSCTKSYSNSDIKVTGQKCGRGSYTGTNIEIGFKVDDSWLSELDVCHNIKEATTLYVTHKLYGNSLEGAIQYSGRTGFSKGSKDLFLKLNPDRLYSKNSQKTTFNEILGKGSGSQYITKDNYIARGHLAPDADFIYVSEQLMTYYYVNVVPQWQPFNAGNWLSVEKTVRKLAKQVGTTLEVYTGASGVLKLPNKDGDDTEIYLEPKKKVLPVPEILWKIVRDPDSKECIVAVGHNNIFLSRSPSPLCRPITSKGWRTLTDLSKGFTYFCDFDSFRAAVPNSPNLKCNDLFQFSGKMTE